MTGVLARIILGPLGLALLAWSARGRVAGPYWRWRLATAYADRRPGRARLVLDALDVGVWAWRMRRLR